MEQGMMERSQRQRFRWLPAARTANRVFCRPLSGCPDEIALLDRVLAVAYKEGLKDGLDYLFVFRLYGTRGHKYFSEGFLDPLARRRPKPKEDIDRIKAIYNKALLEAYAFGVASTPRKGSADEAALTESIDHLNQANEIKDCLKAVDDMLKKMKTNLDRGRVMDDLAEAITDALQVGNRDRKDIVEKLDWKEITRGAGK